MKYLDKEGLKQLVNKIKQIKEVIVSDSQPTDKDILFWLDTSEESEPETFMGIKESGNNGNGYYIKFTDGTLIQRGEADCAENIEYVTITFPTEFIDNNYTIIANNKFINQSGYGGADQKRIIVTSQILNNNSANIYSIFYDNSVANYKRKVQYIAIGCWK